MKKVKLFNFNNGVAYPFHGQYKTRVGKKYKFAEDFDCNVLKKYCRVNTYRYPYVSFKPDMTEIVYIDDVVQNLKKYL